MDIYKKVDQAYKLLLEKYRPYLSVLDHYGIRTNFSVEADSLKSALSKKRLSVEDSDRLTDSHKAYRVEDSVQLEKPSHQFGNADDKVKFFPTLSIYAMLLKNCELYSVNIKEEMLRNLAEGMCIELAMLIEFFLLINQHFCSVLEKPAPIVPEKEIRRQNNWQVSLRI